MSKAFVDFLPRCNPLRVVFHWTGGGYQPSALDLRHYHFCVPLRGEWVPGVHSIADNCRRPLQAGKYAAHIRGRNSFSIGVALCGMAGARQRPFDPGAFPITQRQWLSGAQLVAALCAHYQIGVTPETVFQHGEVQADKWDVCVLPWAPKLASKEVCELFREQVRLFIRQGGK